MHRERRKRFLILNLHRSHTLTYRSIAAIAPIRHCKSFSELLYSVSPDRDGTGLLLFAYRHAYKGQITAMLSRANSSAASIAV